MSRIWFYSRKTWWAEGAQRWGWPYFGADENGRRTVVIGFWFIGYVVFAYKTCYCEDCTEIREQTKELEKQSKLGWEEL